MHRYASNNKMGKGLPMPMYFALLRFPISTNRRLQFPSLMHPACTCGPPRLNGTQPSPPTSSSRHRVQSCFLVSLETRVLASLCVAS